MPTRSLFLNTSNLQLSAYDRGRNTIHISNFQPGIGTIEKVYLSSLVVPTYLVYKNTLNISISLGDLDDKVEVRKEGDSYLYSSFFAKIYSQVSMQSFNLNWYKHGSVVYGVEVGLDNENYVANDAETHSEIQYYIASTDILLDTLVIGEGVRTFKSTITALAGGFSFSGGVADDTFTFVPGLLYIFDVTAISAEWTLELSFDGVSTSYSVEEQTTFRSTLHHKDSNTYELFIPKTKFNTKTAINFHYKKGSEEHIIEHLYSPDTFSSYKVSILKNGKSFLDKTVFICTNTATTTLSILPSMLSKKTAPFFANNKFHYGDLLRADKGDVLTYSLTPQDVEFSYELAPLKLHKHVQADLGERTIQNLYSTFIIDIVEYMLYKKNDLVYTAPSSENQLTNVSNMTMEFFNSAGDDYPILAIDDIQLSLEFATAIVK